MGEVSGVKGVWCKRHSVSKGLVYKLFGVTRFWCKRCLVKKLLWCKKSLV